MHHQKLLSYQNEKFYLIATILGTMRQNEETLGLECLYDNLENFKSQEQFCILEAHNLWLKKRYLG